LLEICGVSNHQIQMVPFASHQPRVYWYHSTCANCAFLA